ncbi:Sigma-70 family RNA polymerase sigma factor [Sulfidibacter corallicola]|uniref:Sigma-70 family RNA polymerase sigma factor n=1 Tax=Sulfidibacter corallicola TaxID=2818388 RepID=A0A8A4TIG5_SULCO|nr:sigma-70 family RNA polymerase sigma factor [Sulfidibacter corallicola]QTD49340.1 sigma-70 family RNA polymerase sigma factor [Sulfidibacter corallicola]
MEHLLDTELVKRAQKGEGRAFDVLVERYQAKITRLVYRYVHDTDTALDLVQDIFFKTFRNLIHFKGESQFSSWIYRIAINDCIDYKRRLKVRKEQSLQVIQDRGYDVADHRAEADVEGIYAAKDQRAWVEEAVRDLPPNQQSVVVMKIYQDMTFDQISEILDEPVSTIKSRLYKALSNLGSVMRRKQVIEEGGLS